VLHAVPDAGEVGLVMNGTTEVFTELGFGDASNYAYLPIEAMDLQVIDENNNPIVEAADLQLAEGVTYDAFVIGTAADPTTLQLLMLETPTIVQVGAQGTPMAVPTEAEVGASPASVVSPTVAGGGGATSTPINAADVTPIQTPEETPTQPAEETPTPTS
jgi:hypothetical protein